MTIFMHDHPLHRHSLTVILDNQQPGGGYLACPNMPDYQFSWFRDGAFIAYALTLEGWEASISHRGNMGSQWDSANQFHSWCAGIVNSRADQLERSIARAQTGHPLNFAETLNARYRPNGDADSGDWPEFQLDGPGTWLWSLAEFVNYARLYPLPIEWEQAIITTARYLAALWHTPCYDCWEERGTDVHISTLGAIYSGLVAAQKLIPKLNFNTTIQKIRNFVLTDGLTPTSELAKSVGLDMVDANLLGVAVPHGLLSPTDPLMQRTVARIERELHALDAGVHRHLADVYYGGGVWVLLALWLAWYYLEIGDMQRADALIAWSESQADANFNLPEQVNTVMLAPVTHYEAWVKQRGPIANPLLWTHAQYLIVRHKRRCLASSAAGYKAQNRH
ncbi:MAG TPA: glycoside hydrolase family 15 protein [Aggregatilineaceae bacterium]|nr:glycoside hydrolase family 15 protein [Aggregatilineaceae bacterium]